MNRTKNFTIVIALSLLSYAQGFTQSIIVLNGGTINLNGGVQLVIENSQPGAITRTSGYIQCIDKTSSIKWMIGTTTGTYTIPWGSPTGYQPLMFSPSGAAGTGYFNLATYPTASWNNSLYLPTGIMHFNNFVGADHSAFSADRFWRIEASGYSTKPSLSNLTFTYSDSEISAAQNTINEDGLRAERWNTSSNTWTDIIIPSVVNKVSNTVTVASLNRVDLYAWWNLSTNGFNKYWISPVSSNSNNSSNWSFTAGGSGGAGVPTASDVVVFNGSQSGPCVINSDLLVGSLTIESGYSGSISQGIYNITATSDLSMKAGTFTGGTGKISVGRNVTIDAGTFTSTSDTLVVANNFAVNGGTFAHNQGTIKFVGIAGQNHSVTSTAAVTMNNIYVNNGTAGSILNIEGNVNANGVLTMGAGSDLDADGSLNTGVITLLSTSDAAFNNAAIAAIPADANIVGSVTVQRFMSIEGPNNARIYRYIGSPLSNGKVSDLQAEIPVTGSFTGTSQCATCATNQSMFEYNESIITDVTGDGNADGNDGYIDFPQSTNTEVMQAGKGYAVYVRGNIVSTAKWDLRGTINKANVSSINLPVTYTTSGTAENDGWNLVSNPLPSTIDWDASGWTKQNLQTAIYIRDNGSTQGRFATYNGIVGTNGGSRYIALGQAFWVKGNGSGAPVLSVTENVKAPYQPATFFRAITPENVVRLIMSQGNETDETVIHFRDDATTTFDEGADAWKKFNLNFNVSSKSSDEKLLAINSWSPLLCSTDVGISIAGTKAGNYVFEFGDLASMDASVQLTLEDKFLNQRVQVTADTKYSFTVNSDPLSSGERFSIHFEKTPAEIIVHQVDDVLSIDFKTGIQWYFNGNAIPDATLSNIVATESGTYSVTVTKNSCEMAGARAVVITAAEQDIDKVVRTYPNPFNNHIIVDAGQPAQIDIMNSIGQIVVTQNIHGRTELDLSTLAHGVYVLRIVLPGRVISRVMIKG
jgi:hypothetical protein